MINDMTCILQISVLHQNFHAASNVQKNKKEKLMGEKDITEKILEDHNDVFADIINVLIHSIKQTMRKYMNWNEILQSTGKMVK